MLLLLLLPSHTLQKILGKDLTFHTLAFRLGGLTAGRAPSDLQSWDLAQQGAGAVYVAFRRFSAFLAVVDSSMLHVAPNLLNSARSSWRQNGATALLVVVTPT